ncbi:MAG: hypothetical protein ACI4PF_06135 [Christensenellales bacterium]
MFNKSKAKIISDAVCGILILLSILTYVLIGVFAHIWHPTWVIILIAIIVDSIVSIVVGAFNRISKKNSDNPKNEI